MDLTLTDSLGKELNMGTSVNTMTPASHHFHHSFHVAIQLNRMHLLTIMLEAGFVHNPYEWWHHQLPGAHEFELIDSKAFARCVATCT